MAEPDSDTLTILVDGRPVSAVPGEMVIAAAERAGVFIPRFCYHPRMKPVGMCRMCLVEIKGPRGFALQPACFVAVADGQEVVTESPKVKKAQDGVLEFLLVNHPLDCPVCDKGGECPLQDQTLSYGPGETRFVEEKRHWAKPIEIGPLVNLDRERCIQCGRCTRFAEEIAGEALIDFYDRGDHIEVATFPGAPFNSYFSGNTVQICPVGALTAVPYRFRARPWDLEQVESTCTTCSVGCRVVLQSSSNELIRMLGVDSDPVNQSWLCDKGRFGYEAVASEQRLTDPLVRKGDELVPASWDEALSAAAEGIRAGRSGDGAEVGVIGGARLANEDAYAWAKLAKSVLLTDSVDAQLGDGLAGDLVNALPRATIDDAAGARVVVTLAPDLREELPVLFLRLRGAAVGGDLRLVELSPVSTSLTPLAAASLAYRPGEAHMVARALTGDGPPVEAGGVPVADIEEARRVLQDAGVAADRAAGEPGGAGGEAGPAGAARPEPRGAGIVVVLGRPSLAESAASIAAAASALAEAWPAARFLSALRRANVHGAIDMGLSPGMLPGRVSLEGGREWYERAWGALPAEPGRDTAGILEAAAAGKMDALVLLASDPVSDFPDGRLAERALSGGAFVVAVDTFLSASSSRADVVLPGVMPGERSGTTTNLEGRVSTLGQKVVPQGSAWPEWMIAAELARRLGSDLGIDSLEGIWEEIEQTCPSHAGLTREVLASAAARDGVVVPIPAIPVQIGATRGRRRPPVKRLDPMATPGIDAVERQGALLRAGSALMPGGDAEPEALPPPTPLEGRPAPVSLPVSGEVAAPPVDAYSHRLVVPRKLYDRGTIVVNSASLAGLVPRLELRLHPADLSQLGVTPGGVVRIRSKRATLEVPAVADEGVRRGSACLPFQLAGSGPAELIEAGEVATDVRLESVDG